MSSHDDIAASKSLRLDEIHQKGKAANIGAESWALHQSNFQGMVQAHNESISALSANFRNLEQQVKAIARVMATQNVAKITENAKLAQEDLQRSMQQYVNDKQRELLVTVEKEVNEVKDVKSGLGKKIDLVESRVMQILSTKFDEASQSRHAMRDEMERLQEAVKDVPQLAEKNAKMLRELDNKIADIKKQFRQFEAEHEVANAEQDKQVAAMLNEVKVSMETAKEKLQDESKSLAKYLKKHEGIMDEKIAVIQDMIEKEKDERLDSAKRQGLEFSDKIHNIKGDFTRGLGSIEDEIERKVRPFFSSIGEIKQMIGEETTHREAAVQGVARALATEKKNRDIDEERLLNMISSCTQALARMQSRPVS